MKRLYECISDFVFVETNVEEAVKIGKYFEDKIQRLMGNDFNE